MDKYKIRNLEINDIHKNIINLLDQLTSTSKVSLIDFTFFVESLHENHRVLVIEDNNKSTDTPTNLAWGRSKNFKFPSDVIYYNYNRTRKRYLLCTHIPYLSIVTIKI